MWDTVRCVVSPCAMAPLYFYLWFILKLTLVTGQPAFYVLKGREAVLVPALNKLPDDILWKHNGDKVITFDGAEERVFEPYHGRVTLSRDTAKLTISDVRYEDSGEFELDAISGERLYRSQYMLKVLDKVSKPVIRCEMNNNHSNIPSATLFCSSPSNTPEALTFMWNLEGKSELGQTLPITLGNGHDDITYSCTANNPLQEETSTFMAKDCYTERTSETLNILVPVVIVSLILLAFCIFSIKFRHKLKRACSKKGKNDDCEKQQKRAERKRDESDQTDVECDPLIPSNSDRQETKPSPQRQNVKSPVVKELQKIFERDNAKTLPGRRYYTGGATSPPTSPSSSVPKPAPGPGQMDSGGRLDLEHKELNHGPKTVEDGDTDSKHSEDEYEVPPQTPGEQGSAVQMDADKEQNECHKEHDQQNQSNSPKDDGQLTNEEKTELNIVTNPDCTVNNKPPKHPKDMPLSPGKVTEVRKMFENRENTETPSGKTPTSPSSSVPKPAPGPGQMDSGGEMDLKHEELNNVPTTEEAGDTDSEHSDEEVYEDTSSGPDEFTKAPDETVLLQPSSPDSAPPSHTDEPPSAEQTVPVTDLKSDPVKPSDKEQLSSVSVSQPQSSQSESDESKDKKKNDGEESNTVGLENNPQRDSDQGSGTSDDKGTEETSQPQNQTPETLRSETTAPPEPGKDQTPESSSVEGKGHDKSNTETQKQDSPCNSSEDNPQKTVTAEFEKTGSNEQDNKSPNPPVSPQSQTTDDDKVNENTGEGAEDDKKEKKDETDKESGSSGSEQSSGDIPG